MKDSTTTTDIVKMHKKCLDLFLKNQSLIYSVEIRNVSGSLSIGIHFVREKFPYELPWVTFYAFQSIQISSKKLAAIEEYLLTGKADFSQMQ
jgi:hypothetical protein